MYYIAGCTLLFLANPFSETLYRAELACSPRLGTSFDACPWLSSKGCLAGAQAGKGVEMCTLTTGMDEQIEAVIAARSSDSCQQVIL